MSAVFGIINKKGGVIQPEMVAKVKQALHHRVVKGYAEVLNNNIAFGFCKLGVYKQSEVGDIPLQAGPYLITANTHLHNRADLCKKLAVDNDLATTYSDAGLILQAYQKWGNDCVHHLEGEFSFAIWNYETQTLFISIDQIGYKPLFYYESADHFIFCSEIKGIEAIKETPNYFNEECLVQFVLYHHDWNGTYNKDIHALYGGSVLHLKEGRVSISKYWQLEPKGRYRFSKAADWYDCLYDLFYKSIENRVDTDANIGMSLSGGLDSGAIACILSDILKKKNKPLLAFSSVLPDSYNGNLTDEKDYINIISRHCGNIINFYETAEGQSLLEEAQARFEVDEAVPLVAQVMNFQILETAKREHTQVYFTGVGGDFWLSAQGYSSLNGLIAKQRYQKAFKLFQQVKQANGLTWWETVRRYILLETKAAKKYYYQRVKWKSKTCLYPRYDKRFDITANKESIETTSLINKGVIGRIMQRLDNRTEFYSMVSANPCFDHRLMEFLADVPLEYFLAGGEPRGLFRNAMRLIVPKPVIERKDKKFYIIDLLDRLNKVPEQLSPSVLDENTLRYFSPQRITDLLADIDKTDPSASNYRVMRVRAWQTLMADAAIRNLIKKNYLFN